jgi:rhodanese-related sulfurtransferase/predicted transcriptional regulator
MSTGSFKKDLFTQFARVGKALSNAHRIELIEFIAQGESNVEHLARRCGMTIANTSQHLQQLRQAGLVTSRKDGQHVLYRLTGNDVIMLLGCLRNVAEHHIAEVERLVKAYLDVRDDLEPLPAVELLERAKRGEISVIDVRPKDEYQAGHVNGASNIPIEELEKHLGELDPGKEIVAYCRGPHCILAFDAVAKLRQKGFHARRLENGYPEWQLAGMPTETGPVEKNSNQDKK